jgi:hypothetical protein
MQRNAMPSQGRLIGDDKRDRERERESGEDRRRPVNHHQFV